MKIKEIFKLKKTANTFFRTTSVAISSDYLQVSKVSSLFSLQFAFRVLSQFSMRIPAAIYRSRSPDSSSPADPSKFLPLSLPGAPSSAGFLDICEPPHVWMSRRNGAANPERRGARVARELCRESESHVRECHRSTSTWCTRIYYERTRIRHANERAARRAERVRNNRCSSRRE